MTADFQTNEKYLSQIPALQLLIAMGFNYLSPAQALGERQERTSNVLLENILRNQLKAINRIRHKGGEYLFSEENIQSAVQKLKHIRYDGLLKTNEAVYDSLTLGTAMEQTIRVIYMRAFDISEHFRSNWQGTAFKAQLVAPGKEAALKYNDVLNEIGQISSAVVISPPDMREGYSETDGDTGDAVVKFWQKMMKRYGREEEYTKQLINQFKHGKDPEILIVVDKLLTGFDAPSNTVLALPVPGTQGTYPAPGHCPGQPAP